MIDVRDSGDGVNVWENRELLLLLLLLRAGAAIIAATAGFGGRGREAETIAGFGC